MRISDFGFRISDFRRRRRGVTIIEVLFAIMVVAIGLFGALALLPAAIAQARKGLRHDALSAIGPMAVGQFDAMGMRQPGGWIGWNENWDIRNPPPAFQFAFVAPMNFPYGTAFCIDPRMVAMNSGNAASAKQASLFPYVARTAATDPRMFRITLDNGSRTGTMMGLLQAESLFSIADDLTYDRPKDQSLAPWQKPDPFPDTTITVPARRQSDGHFSWMATLVPKLDRYSLTPSDTYILSIVVFYDRPADLSLDLSTGDAHERVLTATLTGAGVTGGEVLLQGATEDALKVHPNDWIMLAGNTQHAVDYPGPFPAQGRRYVNVFKWYRIAETEAEVTFNGTNYERYVTLVGQDWDASLAAQAVILTGVVGVFEKTIRLEN